MTFRRFLMVTVYGIVLCGWGAIWISERVHPILMIVALAAILVGIVADRRGRHPLKPSWNRLLLVLGIAGAVVDWRLGTRSWFLAIVLLLVYVSAVRALAPKANRDLQQMIGLAFLQLLAASVLTASAAYALFFLAFFILVPFALLAVTVKAEFEGETDILRGRVAEGGEVSVPPGADRLLGSGAVFAILTALGMTMAITVLFFLAFPRLSTGTFQGRLALDVAVSGLSNEVRLGSYGTILEDSGPAARLVWLEGRPPLPDSVYLRGMALDEFDGAVWRAGGKTQRIYSTEGTFGERKSDATHRVRIFLEDIGTSILPVIPVSRRLELPDRFLIVDELGGFQRPDRAGPYRYEVDTRPGDYLSARVAWADLPAFPPLPIDLARIAELPAAAGLPTEVAALVVGPTLAWVPDFLAQLGGFRYTLETPAGTAPLTAFWQRRAGHCELFATTLALAFRAAGIPAVVVNGFRGAEWMDDEDYMLVRRRNAHSWVEIYHPDLGGWLPLDPTPGLEDRPDLAARLTEAFQRGVDGFRLWWLDRVVEYDLDTQAQAVKAARRVGGGFEGRLRGWSRDLQEFVAGVSRGLLIAVGLGMAALAALVVRRLWGRRRRAAAGSAGTGDTPRWLYPLLREIERRAGPRPTGLPLEAWLAALDDLPEAAALRLFAARYGAWRFGNGGDDGDLRREARRLRHRLRDARRAR
jgi:transglutaminase-like putative cysteine protease